MLSVHYCKGVSSHDGLNGARSTLLSSRAVGRENGKPVVETASRKGLPVQLSCLAALPRLILPLAGLGKSTLQIHHK